MSKIAEGILVRCPFKSAAAHMDAYLATLNKTASCDRRITLKAPLGTLGLPGGLAGAVLAAASKENLQLGQAAAVSENPRQGLRGIIGSRGVEITGRKAALTGHP